MKFQNNSLKYFFHVPCLKITLVCEKIVNTNADLQEKLFFFFGTMFTILYFIHNLHKWAQVLHYSRLVRYDTYEHSSLLALFVRYKENEVWWIRLQGPYSQHFIFIFTYEKAQ